MCLQKVLQRLQKALEEVNSSLELINNERCRIEQIGDTKAKETALKEIKDLSTEEQEMFFHPTLFMAKKVCSDVQISRIMGGNTITFIEKNNFSGDLYTNPSNLYISLKIIDFLF